MANNLVFFVLHPNFRLLTVSVASLRFRNFFHSSLKTVFHHCTFSFITAHFRSSLHIFVHHCIFSFITAHFRSSLHILVHHYTLKEALISCDNYTVAILLYI